MGLGAFTPVFSHAAEPEGGPLSGWWGEPLAGPLESIALLPLIAPSFWHHHIGKVSAAWAAAFLLPCAVLIGANAAAVSAAHAMVAEFIPFFILITSLFVVAGGICVRGNLRGTPTLNTGGRAGGAGGAGGGGAAGAAGRGGRPGGGAGGGRGRAARGGGGF